VELERNGTAAADPAAGGGPWREPVRWLALPWALLVLYPVVAVTTTFWGALAVALSAVSRRVAFHCGTVWAWGLAWTSLVRVRVAGREHTRHGQSYVIMCNHQGAFDVLALYGFLRRQFRWVMKAELRAVPFLGWGCAAIGHIFVDRGNPAAAIASLEAAKPRLAGGVSALFFPEGTRTTDGRLRPFKKGGFLMAKQLGLPILPVSLSGSSRILPKRCLVPRPGTIRVLFHPPLDPASFPTLEDLMTATRAAIASGLEPGEGGEG
jgi:1-acyl-sn-glycerol-3-phosphate acyltransferase